MRVRTVSVNGGELSARAGRIRLVTGNRFPQGMGVDFAGEIADPGTTSQFSVGDRVWGVPGRRLGTAAEYVTMPVRKLARIPAELSYAEAVSLMSGGVTAGIALDGKARLRPGERLLVRGGSGGVGSVAVQVGKVMGAHVTALAGGSNLDFVRELGADEVFDDRTTRLEDLGRFDVVLDTVGTRHRRLRGMLRPGGRMVAIVFDLDHRARSLGYIAASVIFGSRRVRFFSAVPGRSELDDLARLVEAGRVRPVIDTVHTLDEIADAHRALEAGGVRGKHVIQIA